MPNTIRGLFVGCGEITQVMADRLSKAGWFRAVGLVDPNEKAAASTAQVLGLRREHCYSGLSSALAQLEFDVALINSPAEFHAGQAREVLSAGKHVLVAKPLATTYAQALDLAEQARSRGLRLDVAEQMRYHPHFRAVRDFILSGELGRVQVVHFLNSKPRLQVRNLIRMDQPALLEMASHHFDIWMSFFPANPPEWVMVDGFQPAWSRYAGPCMVHGLLRLGGNLHVLYAGGYSSQAPCYELRLEGEKGALRCRGTHMSAQGMVYEFAPSGSSFSPIDLERRVQAGESWNLCLAAWRSALEQGAEVPFSAANNLKIMALIDAAIRSSEAGAPVDLNSEPRYMPAFAGGSEWRKER